MGRPRTHHRTAADTVPESLSNQGHSYEVEHKCYEARLFCESLLKGNHSIIGLIGVSTH